MDSDGESFYSIDGSSTVDSVLDDDEDITKTTQAQQMMARILTKTNATGYKIELLQSLAMTDSLAKMNDLHKMMGKMHAYKAKMENVHKMFVQKLDEKLDAFEKTTSILQWTQDVAVANNASARYKRKHEDID